MNSQRLYIVTGSSSGLGLEMCKQLIESGCTVLGISRSKSKIDNTKYFHLIHDFKSKININEVTHLKINFETKIYVILNAAQRYDNEYDINNFFKTFLASFDVNFYNQIDFIKKISQEKKIEKLFFISSYAIFTSGNRDIGYYLAKDNYYKITLLLEKHYRINCKSIIVGAMKTRMLSEKPSVVSKLPFIGKYLEKKLSISTNDVAKKIIENFENKKNIILIPNIPIFLVKIIVKIVEIISIKK
jgi:short-subunit dehydrogenase